MTSFSPFLSLPREIRDKIYEHYVTVPGGYKCDPSQFAANVLARKRDRLGHFSLAGILKDADGQAIDLNMLYTCRLVASEMHGVALRINTISFSTVTSDRLRSLALEHQLTLGHVKSMRRELTYYVVQIMSEKSLNELKLKYPPFVPILEKMRAEGEYDIDMMWKGPYGEANSLWWSFCKDVLELGLPPDVGHEAVRRYHSDYTRRWYEELTLDDYISCFAGVLDCQLTDWSIPTEDIITTVGRDHMDQIEQSRGMRDRVKYRFSAAAAAIFFLNNLDIGLRTTLRRIVLNEDGEAIGYPQSHAMGLIPFCQQNPRLFVERRVDLWRNALQWEKFWSTTGSQKYKYQDTHRTTWQISSSQITQVFNNWIIEGLALAAAGMPAKSFRLVLDGQPLPHLVTEMFQSVVQRDVARQLAWEESVKRGIISAPPLFDSEVKESLADGHVIPWNHFKHLPRAIRDIAENRSVVRCNFDVGEPWDVEMMVHDNKNWTVTQWRKEMGNGHEPETWETEAPLPPWRSVLEENLVPIPDVLDMGVGAFLDSLTDS